MLASNMKEASSKRIEVDVSKKDGTWVWVKPLKSQGTTDFSRFLVLIIHHPLIGVPNFDHTQMDGTWVNAGVSYNIGQDIFGDGIMI